MSPVTIPALTTMGPEWVLIPTFYFLQERTHLRLATLSSWLKQTILLYYKQADQQALDLVQVKVHDIRAFSASKAFYNKLWGISGPNHASLSLESSQHIY